MKKLKKMLCMLLCLVMAAVILAMPAAADNDEDMARKIELWNKTGDMITLANDKMYSFNSKDKSIYTNETEGLLWEKTDTVSNYYYDPDRIYDKWFDEPVERLQQMYDELLAAYEGLKVDVAALRDLYDKVKDEENEADYFAARYYPKRMWRSFCAARQTAQDVLAAQSQDDDTVTGAYFALRSAFNELCKSNQTLGDIDKNDKVDVSDVLYVQKYLAGIVKLNSSQKFVASVTDFAVGAISINDVTNIQKYLVGFKEELLGFDLSRLNHSDKNPLTDNGWII